MLVPLPLPLLVIMEGSPAYTKPAFEDRAASVFAALGQPGQLAGGWALTTDQGFKAGDDAAASSEDEKEAAAEVPKALAGVAESQQEEDEYNKKASCQYRQAFEEEEEEDMYDTLAAEGLHRVKRVPAGDGELPRSMEVLDDNVYDRQYEARRQSGRVAGSSGMAEAAVEHELITHTVLRDAAPDAQPQASVRNRAGSKVWVPPHRRVDFKPRPDAEGTMPPPPSRGRGAANGRGRGRAVPDHVKHPHKYTVYTFDEPVEVGGGIKGSSADRELQQAAASAQAAAHAAKEPPQGQEPEDTERDLPQFGAGIEFRPKAKRHQAAHPSSERRQPAAASNTAMGTFMQEDEGDDVDAAPPAIPAASAPAAGHAWQGSAASMDVDDVDELHGQEEKPLGNGRAAGAASRRRALRTKPANEED